MPIEIPSSGNNPAREGSKMNGWKNHATWEFWTLVMNTEHMYRDIQRIYKFSDSVEEAVRKIIYTFSPSPEVDVQEIAEELRGFDR